MADTSHQGRRQVQKCGVDRWHAWRARAARAYNGGLGMEPPAGSRGKASPWSWKPFCFWCPVEAANLLHSPWPCSTPNPLLPSKKLIGFASISGTTSGKYGVDMSTPIHPVATPLLRTLLENIGYDQKSMQSPVVQRNLPNSCKLTGDFLGKFRPSSRKSSCQSLQRLVSVTDTKANPR